VDRISAHTGSRFGLKNVERWVLNILSRSQATLFLDYRRKPWHRIDLQYRVDILPSLLIDWHLHPNLLHAIQVNVGKAESRFLVRNVVALGQDCPPRIHNLSDQDISNDQETSHPTTTQLAAPLKGVDHSSRTDVPWRVPSLFGFACAVQRRQRRSHRFAFRSHGFEGESPNGLPQS